MYRSGADRGAEAANGTTLQYFPEHRGHDSTAQAGAMFVVPVLVAIAVAMLGARELAVPALVATGIALYVARRRERARPAATIEVVDRALRVHGRDRSVKLQVPLDDLVDVALDTKTIERVQEAPGPIAELRFVNSTVGGAIDVARIELLTRDGASVRLTEEYLSHTDSLEWRGKMRRFLRKHGWQPESERQVEPAPKPKRATPRGRGDRAPG